MVTHTSDYFELLGKMARDFAAAGNAYMDDTDQETVRAARRVRALCAATPRDARAVALTAPHPHLPPFRPRRCAQSAAT